MVGLLTGWPARELIGWLVGRPDRQAKTQIAANRGADYASERAANVVRSGKLGRQLKWYGVLSRA